MNGNERNFDFADYLVGIQRDQRRITGVSGNSVAIYQFLGITDAMEISDDGVVIAQAPVGIYDTSKYGFCVYG